MQAAIRTKYGLPQTIKIEEVKTPTPKQNQILIKVEATTVNRTDASLMTGKPYIIRAFIGLFRPRLTTLGTDFAGSIVDVGKEVTEYKKGDRVFGFNDEGLSSQAEFMTLSEKGNIAKIPEWISYEEAAASMEGAHYALNFINKVELQAGQNILLNGATGAIGSALLQFLKFQGIQVTAVCNTKNMERIKELGADKLFDYQKEDFTKADGQYNFIFDAVGKSSFGKCKHLLKPGGTYISSELGPGAENLYLPFTTYLSNKKVRFPLPSNIKRSILFICDLLEAKKFKPIIDCCYSLEQIAEAYDYVATGEKTGNVIVKI